MRIEIPFFKTLKRKFRAALGIKKKPNYPALPALGPFTLKPLAPEDISLPTPAAAPKLSILIADDGRLDHTLNCLATIADHPPQCSFEILIAAGGADSASLESLRRVANVAAIVAAETPDPFAGFNLAASRAVGDYLCCLGEGAAPLAGAMDALMALAESVADAGLVSARPVRPDGRQFNAGGIVWSDGSTALYGADDDPLRPEYQYVRQVDTIPAASFVLPRMTWRALGGFAEQRGAALDFACRLRGMGKSVYFQPAANIVHFVDQSAAEEPERDAGAVQWSDRFAEENLPAGAGTFRARERARKRRIMLFVDRYAPEPDKDAGSRTMDDFIRSFQAMGWIVKFWPQNLKYNRVYMSGLQQMGVETFYGPYETSMADWLARHGGDIDAAFISRPEIAAEFLPDIRKATAAPVLFYGHDLHFARRRLEAKITGKVEFEQLAAADEAAERRIWREVDVVLYPTQDEADEVVSLEPGVTALATPAYCFDHVAERPTAPPGQSILFVAGFDHTPNVDAATWFATEILPLVRRIHPGAKLSLVGSGARPRVAHLAGEGVEVIGWVSQEELQARYDAARLAVMPLRFGAGIKLKVVEALAAGLPLVTTTIGAQGLAGLETVCGVEDDAQAFAAAATRLLAANDAEWLAVSRRQARFIADKFRREGQIEALRAALAAAGARRG